MRARSAFATSACVRAACSACAARSAVEASTSPAKLHSASWAVGLLRAMISLAETE